MAAILALLATSSIAHGADLGGDCCADLEERIAELEATTARKGNRKVSLEIYGQINEAVLFWDDGVESNAHIVTNDNARSRVGFRGKAKINDDWEAGYRLEIGVRSVNSKRFTQNDPKALADSGLDMRDSHWYLKSKTFGAVYVGLGTSATNMITELNLSQTASFSKYSDTEDSGLGLLLRSATNGRLSALSWRRLIGDGGDQPGEGERALNLVRYESPTLWGFTASGSWGEDDIWDVALRYAGEAGGFKYTAGIGYGVVLDDGQTQTVCPGTVATGGSDTRCDNFGGSLSIMHEETGLFANIGAGRKVDDLIDEMPLFAGTGVDDEQTFWAAQAGIEKKFNSYGKTTVYGEYYSYEGGGNGRRTVDGPDGGAADALNPFATGGDSAIFASGVDMYGAGIAQGFDDAALLVYLSYRHYEADLTLRQIAGGSATGAVADVALEDLDIVMTGAMIKF
ncbi:MAG: hypothetical protein JNL45_17195 [Hyphomicrobium sp.]|nr:hypothetical protein [Hyphomicrobium sp.]